MIARLRRSVPLAVLAVLLQVACSTGDLQVATEPTAAASQSVVPAVATPLAGVPTFTPPPDLFRVAVRVANPGERARVEATLRSAAGTGVARSVDTANMTLADEPFAGAERIVLARWAAATDQRRDVLELTRDQVVRAFRGDAVNWWEFGGRPTPITALLRASDADAVAAALGIHDDALVATLVTDDQLLEQVASIPGSLALVQPEELRLGVLALVVDGHDPYRDPANDSPLHDARWITADRPDRAAEIGLLLGLAETPDFDPVGMLATGELIPVRCTYDALVSVGRFGAIFDGTGDLIRAADIAVAPLDTSLTDRSPPTPCRRTFRLQGPAAVAPAIAEAGIDVVITAGNHVMDCWNGCSPTLALLDTLENLRAAGVATAGAGTDIAAARAAAVLVAETLDGPVRFAFLGYDSIASALFGAGPTSAGTAPLDAASLRADIAAALVLADHVIVAAAWGAEYTSDPVAFQTDTAFAAIESGATFVLGHHPHWVQAVEHFPALSPAGNSGDALVIYSVGNFVFDQNWSLETTQGMVMELGFSADRLLGYRIRPVVIHGLPDLGAHLYRPEFVDPATSGRSILNRIWSAQDRLDPR